MCVCVFMSFPGVCGDRQSLPGHAGKVLIPPGFLRKVRMEVAQSLWRVWDTGFRADCFQVCSQ